MNRNTLALMATMALLTSGDEATAKSSGGYSMQVLVDGRAVTEYNARGKTYIEARRGKEYTIRLTNSTGSRVAVALSVDGLNSIDARHTSAREATKWVIAPWSTVEIKGWQTSTATSRSFFFTTEESSYGAWLGDTNNLGIISAAWFPEEVPPPVTYYLEGDEADSSWFGGAGVDSSRSKAPAAESAATGASAPAPTRSSAGALSSETRESVAKKDLAATGIGREQRNHVTQVEMEIGDTPAAVTSVRYEYRDALIKLGVLPKPQPRPVELDRRERSDGFAPDPYRQGW